MTRTSFAPGLVLLVLVGTAVTGPVAASPTAEAAVTDQACIPVDEHPRPDAGHGVRFPDTDDRQATEIESGGDVTNPASGQGGADAEPVASVVRRTPTPLRESKRADATDANSEPTSDSIAKGGQVVDSDDVDRAAAIRGQLDEAGDAAAIRRGPPLAPCDP